MTQKVSEYDTEMPQSHTTDQPKTLRGRVEEHHIFSDYQEGFAAH